MYFLRFRRLPLVLLIVIGFTMSFPEPYQAIAHFLAWASSTIMLVEHLLILAVSVHYGGWSQGAGVAGLAIMMSGMTLPEFYDAAQKIVRRTKDDLAREQVTAAQRARFAEAARQAAQVEREARARRYAKRLRRLLGEEAPEVEPTSQALATFPLVEAEARLRRAERMAVLLREADKYGREHVGYLTQLFDQRQPEAEEERRAQTYLARVRRRHGLLEEAHRLQVGEEVSRLLQQDDEAAANVALTRARASAARHLELLQLKAQVDRSPAHSRGHLNELLAVARAQAHNPREFRKAVHALRQAMPKNGDASPRT